MQYTLRDRDECKWWLANVMSLYAETTFQAQMQMEVLCSGEKWRNTGLDSSGSPRI
jgi:hypothetical protein